MFCCRSFYHHFITSTICVVLAAAAGCWPDHVRASDFVLVCDGQPAATIVTAAAATDVAAFAAQELQYHVRKITGATLPIKFDAEKVEGARILVGPSVATAQLGLKPDQFKDQEYLIHFVGNTLILLGKDAPSRVTLEKAKDWSAAADARVPPPPMFEEQATSYAVHDFLERFCDVRWFGPGELEMVLPKKATLVVQPREVRRAPAIIHRYPDGPMKIITEQWNRPSPQDLALFWSRLRAGGEKYSCNHSFYGYYDRFWVKNPKCPEVFVAAHPDWFAQGYSASELKIYDKAGRPAQMCYSNQGFIDQVVADARKFFDVQSTMAGVQASGEYFGLVPMDISNHWCRCAACQAQLTRDRNNHEFSNGIASDYIFTFANKVAREVAKTHPDKYLSMLAYNEYAYYPSKVRPEPNISVQMCLQARHWWAPGSKETDTSFYHDWVSRDKGRRLYVWLYYCFPELLCDDGNWRCFPGFSAHNLDQQIKMFARDGIRGAFLNYLGEQVDFYITLKLFDDPSLDIDALLEDFFTRYYGPAGEPLKRFYLRVEDIYSNPANYPEEVRKNHFKQWHQTQEMAWKYLGTEARMAELGAMMAEAERAPVSDIEKQRVALFRKAVWDYMVEGRKQYWAKHQKTSS
jgi:hypothetical protein